MHTESGGSSEYRSARRHIALRYGGQSAMRYESAKYETPDAAGINVFSW
jgi:hypothetical protein